MTHSELTKELAKRVRTDQLLIRVVLDELADIVAENMAQGEKTSIVGFGTFLPGHRAARHGVDPRTLEDIQIPAMAQPKFRYSGQFNRRFR